MNRIVFTMTIVLGFMTPLAAASAHENDYRDDYGSHRQHTRFHDEIGDAHERAHEEGFESRREHRTFHRALRYLHREYHHDRPYWWKRYW